MLLLFIGYLSWSFCFRLIVLTLVTYALMSSQSRLEDIGETFRANEVLMSTVSSVGFVALLILLYPLTSTHASDLLRLRTFKTHFSPGLVRGLILGLGLVLAFTLPGFYQYLGFFVQSDETLFAGVNVGLKMLVIITFVYSEEFLFRQKMLGYIRHRFSAFAAVCLTGCLYCAVKWYQFDLSFAQMFTLFLISLVLGLKALTDQSFYYGAGFWAGLLIAFHPVSGLSIYGNDFSGIFFLKYQNDFTPALGEASAALQSSFFAVQNLGNKVDPQIAQLLTGGMEGPLASIALQTLLAFQVIRSLIRNKNFLFSPFPSSK